MNSPLNALSASIYPVILSGGSGTRLWPLSTKKKPKQFLPIVTEQSMMQDTVARVTGPAFAPPLVVSSADHGGLVAGQLDAIGQTASAILLEPEGRNTAAAIALAAHWIAQADADALMLVMPSDHVIADVPAFHAAIAKGVFAAKDGYLVTFGIQPVHAETGFGYIERGDALAGHDGVHAVAGFHEKPSLALARDYVSGGRHYWNGGIFLFTARAYLTALERHAPDVATASRAAMSAATRDGDFTLPARAPFLDSPDISVDNAVMERADRRAVVLVDMGWSDVGSWDALWSIRTKDDAGNAIKGSAIASDANNNLIYVDGGPPVAALGISDSIIVSTAEGVLIIPRDRTQDVKQVVELVRAGGFDSGR
ncbi:MAG: mannose-1-phosphate guanylyltransferase/mannose-6-phosphate isomerase [Sphingobium sp.]